MTAPVLVDVGVGSGEWHDERRKGITASEMPTLLGLSPDAWASPYSLYWRKRGEVADDRDSAAMEWGRDLEAAILARFAREHPDLGVTEGALYRSGDDPRFMATPDGLAYQPTALHPMAVVQVKTAGSQEHWGEEGTDEIPVQYVAQVRFEMLVMDVRTAFVPVLFSGRTYREYIVDQDDADVAFMIGEALDFLHRLDVGNSPDVDWRISTTQALKQLHPEVEDAEVEIPATWIRQAQLAARLEKAAGKRKTLAENRIRAAMGRAQRATVNGRKVATRSVYEMKARTMPATTAHRLTLTRKDLTA